MQNFTDSQIMRKVIARTKVWLKIHDLDKHIHFRFIRGTYYFDNCVNYLHTAKDILEAATGLHFMAIGDSAAKLSNCTQPQNNSL